MVSQLLDYLISNPYVNLTFLVMIILLLFGFRERVKQKKRIETLSEELKKWNQPRERIRTYNCVRTHIGSYVGGGTNQFERNIDCGYSIEEGRVTVKKLRPIKVTWTNSEGTTSLLQTVILYPVTKVAIVEITNSRGTKRVRLVKRKRGKRSKILKVRH